jgi:hypothetical protein
LRHPLKLFHQQLLPNLLCPIFLRCQ